ncbi:unnamed protein product [Sphenostylis stenocarpa]|uniref:Uncharacterized protein n=1 Tax=Sphenostylis stenocarpa TaxID=92480 RepID=A0AA86RPH0_9FABA|nr:unnamed protein product [Sphenostylis stenocarpa]
MLSEGANNHSSKMSFRITKDDRFFSRLMTKEANTPNSSSRIFYYRETSVAVPFTWEAQPGTPKHPLSETSLPPLTPPPSYFSNSHSAKGRNSKANNIFSSILPRLLGSRKSHHESPSSSSRSPSSSSSSSSSWTLAYHSMRDKDQGQQGRSPSFSRPVKPVCCNGFRGCYPFGNMIRNVNVSHGAD